MKFVLRYLIMWPFILLGLLFGIAMVATSNNLWVTALIRSKNP